MFFGSTFVIRMGTIVTECSKQKFITFPHPSLKFRVCPYLSAKTLAEPLHEVQYTEENNTNQSQRSRFSFRHQHNKLAHQTTDWIEIDCHRKWKNFNHINTRTQKKKTLTTFSLYNMVWETNLNHNNPENQKLDIKRIKYNPK